MFLRATTMPNVVDDMMKRGTIEIAPLAFMRGRTFKDAFIIGDEMQNSLLHR
jgi:phosphate starvation-inducible protein PhoH and related proteins